MNQSNVMLQSRIAKVVVNIAKGQSGEPLEKAMEILEQITRQKPCMRKAKRTIRAFGIRRNEPISCLVTLRGRKAETFLKQSFESVGNRISRKSFDENGNFAFGIREHIDLPGTKYDPNLGITGMDVIVNVERPGYRVKHRRKAKSKIGRSHRLTRDDAIE
ncbi:50S ribosomal protein L5, partial [Candidatus Bathyarchaeota archaeon]|nr:50S ribosomal protein L5 [Candidatus Bathyarchaeota archaeon]